MEKIERWKQRGTLAIRLLLLTIAGIFTIFPFVWMIVSALKTKAEIMDTSVFFAKVPQWANFKSIFSPF